MSETPSEELKVTRMLTHHKLKVYEKALLAVTAAEELCASWDKRHAIVDHFRRASESTVLNIAQASRLRSGPDKTKTLDYALGSTLECAACLDIAAIKGLLSADSSLTEKMRLLEIARMLIGLRKAWLRDIMREEPPAYKLETVPDGVKPLFHHESLDVYRVALDFVRWFVKIPGAQDLSKRLCREMDKSATSVVLNVAEGNGRYSELDHRHFFEIAATSAVKTAAYLDLYSTRTLSAPVQADQGREFLSRVVAMLQGF